MCSVEKFVRQISHNSQENTRQRASLQFKQKLASHVTKKGLESFPFLNYEIFNRTAILGNTYEQAISLTKAFTTLLTLVCILLKNGQICFKNLALGELKAFQSDMKEMWSQLPVQQKCMSGVLGQIDILIPSTEYLQWMFSYRYQ